MLLSEAAKTGRKFRRKSEPETWYWLEGSSMRFRDKTGVYSRPISAEMLVATDWEAESKIIQVTAEELMVVARNLSSHKIVNQRRLAPIEFMKLVIEELGLNE